MIVMVVLDGLVESMNDKWVRLSKQSNTASLSRRLQYLDKHEVWLDTLNLHETCWILFAGDEIHINESFGWPRKN